MNKILPTREAPLSGIDAWIAAADNAMRTLSGVSRAGVPSPSAALASSPLSNDERALSGALMRVNHVGEVCAQALYNAQALTSDDPALRAQFDAAAREEADHLAWTRDRITELGTRPSLLNPLWYAGAFGIGCLAGITGRRVSLGFVVETERQVEAHLDSHLTRLPPGDLQSRAIVTRMKADEARHADAAELAGGSRLPAPIRRLMAMASKIMTSTASRI